MLGGAVVVRVLDDALAHLEGQVETAELGVAKLEVFDDAQRLQVVVEELAVTLHAGIEGALSGVPERRMPDVMHQRQGLDEIDVQVERSGDGAGNLRDLHRVRQAGAKVVGVAAGEDLRLVLQPAESAGVNDAVTVALEGVAIRVRRLGIAASAGVFDANRVGGEHGESVPKISFEFRTRSNRGFTRMTRIRLGQRPNSSGQQRAIRTRHRRQRSLGHGKATQQRGMSAHSRGQMIPPFPRKGRKNGAPSDRWHRNCYSLPAVCLASFTLADSRSFCTLATSSVSTSAGTVLFHSSRARCQWVVASLRRPVFW